MGICVLSKKSYYRNIYIVVYINILVCVGVSYWFSEPLIKPIHLYTMNDIVEYKKHL